MKSPLNGHPVIAAIVAFVGVGALASVAGVGKLSPDEIQDPSKISTEKFGAAELVLLASVVAAFAAYRWSK